jgi:hypothetical protein
MRCIGFALAYKAQQACVQGWMGRVHDSYDHGFLCAMFSKVMVLHCIPSPSYMLGSKSIWLAIFSITGVFCYDKESDDERGLYG